jgi:hypothetical protein
MRLTRTSGSVGTRGGQPPWVTRPVSVPRPRFGPPALRVHVQGQAVNIKLTPEPVCVNPVFELTSAPGGELMVMRDGQNLGSDRYAWDGRVLWLNATIIAPTVFNVRFAALNANSYQDK